MQSRYDAPFIEVKEGPFRQEPVLAAARTHDTIVWSKEVTKFGQRRYFTAGIRAFRELYYRAAPDDRTWYEDIEDDRPIKLFFDLDGPPGCQLDFVVRELTVAAQRYFPGVVPDVLQLDSSHSGKSSRHVVITNWIVGSISQMKRLVALILLDIPEPVKEVTDASVYTKNRPFRLWLSHKFGKSAVLNLYNVDPVLAQNADLMFDDLLVSWVPEGKAVNVLSLPEPTITSIKSSTREQRIYDNAGNPDRRAAVFYPDHKIAMRYVAGLRCKHLGRVHNKRLLRAKYDFNRLTVSFACDDTASCFPGYWGTRTMTKEEMDEFAHWLDSK